MFLKYRAMKKIGFLFLLCIYQVATAQFAGNTYVVIASVKLYKDTMVCPNLSFPENDGNKLYNYLTSKTGGNVPEANVTKVFGNQATAENILAALKSTFAKATEKDRVLFYFSGHGAPDVFCPYDFTIMNNAYANMLKHSDVRDVFKSCKAGIKLCFADACHSGTIKAGEGQTKSITEGTDKQLAVNQDNILVFMSSKSSESSIEYGFLQEGAFTFNLIEGLKGKADLNKDKLVTVKELYSYVRQRVRAFTKAKQTPVMFGKFDPEMVMVNLK